MTRSRANRDKRRVAREMAHSANVDSAAPVGASGIPEPKAVKSGRAGKSKPRSTDRGERPGFNGPVGHQFQVTRPQASLTPQR